MPGDLVGIRIETLVGTVGAVAWLAVVPSTDLLRVGKYLFIEELAAGGMATVYLAIAHGSVGFRKLVAGKRCHPQLSRDPDFVAMFTDEARLTSHISHPNVAETLDVFRHDGELLLALAYIHGVPLSVMGSKQRALEARFPHAVAVAVLSGVLDGLEAAHRAKDDDGEPLGIVHRDVSPQNILAGIDGTPRLIDFGDGSRHRTPSSDRRRPSERKVQLHGSRAAEP